MANVNNYIAAANAAVKKAVMARKALAENKPRYDEQGKANIKAKAEEKIVAMKANQAVANATLDAATRVEGANIKVDRDKSIASSRRTARKAGLIAGGAAMLGVGHMMMKRKHEPDAMLSSYASMRDKLTGQITDVDKDYAATQAKLNSLNAAVDTTKSSDTSETTVVPQGQTGNTGANAWQKLSRVIRYGEGTLGDKGYNTQFTGSQFTDMSRHPRQIKSGGGYRSDAAGAYQFLSTTWDGAKKALGLKDFSPESQEKAGRYLTKNRGVNPDQEFKTIDEFRSAMDKLAPEWASLPYSGISPSGHGQGSSYYGQGGKTLEDLWRVYQGN